MPVKKRSRILFISDLHYTPYHNEEDQGEWLLSLIDNTNPDILLSAGDWDELADADFLAEVTRRVPLLTIYGNHENMDALKTVTNPMLDNINILLEDYKILDLKERFGFNIVGVSGIWSSRRSSRQGVPRKKGDKFIRLAKEFYERYHPEPFQIDILLMHDVPDIPVYGENIVLHGGTSQVREVTYLLKPKIVLNGHLHISEYTFTKLDYGGYYLRVDSSKKHRGFALIDWSDDVKIRVYKESMDNTLFTAVLSSFNTDDEHVAKGEKYEREN